MKYRESLRVGLAGPCARVVLSGWLLAALAAAVTPAALAAQDRKGDLHRCDLPRAAWNDEIIVARDAAIRECKENVVRHATDFDSVDRTEAQAHFQSLKSLHERLLGNAKAAAGDKH